MKIWLREHRFALREALRKLCRTPISFIFNVVVVAIALALPIAGFTLLENVRPLSSHLSVDPEVSVFLSTDISDDDAKSLEWAIYAALPADNKKIRIEFIDRSTAFTNLKNKTGLSETLASLDGNPLPHAYIVKLPEVNADQIDLIATKLVKLPGVDTVQIDSVWVKRLAALIGVLKLSLFILALTLGVVVVAVVFNTIRLLVLTQKDEIIVSRLVGATDAFIHRPFYYAGAILGLCAGAVALGAVALTLPPMNNAIAVFAKLYASEFTLLPLDIAMSILLLVGSAILGLAGALVSVKRHLAKLG